MILPMELIFLAASVMIGLSGMIGIRQKRALCLILSSCALPALFLLALWAGMGLETISCCFCVTAFFALCGVRDR